MKFKTYWMQVRVLTIASIKSRYRKTWAGFLWVVLSPIIMFGVQSLVFRKFLRLQMPDYFLFLTGGLLPWIFISTTIQMGTPIFVQQSHLLRSFKVNPWVILCAQVLDNFINFMISFLIILLPLYVTSDRSFSTLLLLPLALLPMFIGTLAITVSLSVLNIFYRDINFIMGFLFSLLFFLTPVFYPKSFVPEEWQWVIVLNPMIYFIDPFRTIIYAPDSQALMLALIKSSAVAGLFCLIAFLVWKRKRNDFYRKL
ncbi:MAG TPA: ABC transporter permease [Bacteriovoracaceae bacterium]|nr:ABC transporter permease [Bacteriovoracaceae bacterium]